jgi:hypothetical protein
MFPPKHSSDTLDCLLAFESGSVQDTEISADECSPTKYNLSALPQRLWYYSSVVPVGQLKYLPKIQEFPDQ